MNFIYRRGLLRGKPGQKVAVQVEGGDVRIRHTGLLSHWQYQLPCNGIRAVRVDGETLELDVGPADRLVRIVLEGPDARAVHRQISRLLDFADAVTELSRGLSHPRVL